VGGLGVWLGWGVVGFCRGRFGVGFGAGVSSFFGWVVCWWGGGGFWFGGVCVLLGWGGFFVVLVVGGGGFFWVWCFFFFGLVGLGVFPLL